MCYHKPEESSLVEENVKCMKLNFMKTQTASRLYYLIWYDYDKIKQNQGYSKAMTWRQIYEGISYYSIT